MTTKLAKGVAAMIVAITLLFAVTSCSTTQKIDMTAVTSVIDVRTPEEFAAGHLTGALNIDIEGADFSGAVSSLDKTDTYVLYCRSGRRAGIALETMKSLGFTNLENAGGLDEAAVATGLAITE
jgi:rhodanese-related sulfurtransferase